MPNYTQVTLPEIKEIVSNVVLTSKAGAAWQSSFNLTTDCLQKIGKMYTVRGMFEDKLPELDGDPLPLGKIVEEFYRELAPLVPYDRSGANALAPVEQPYMKSFYSYPLERQTIPVQKRYDEFEACSINEAALAGFINGVLESMEETNAQYRYAIKRQMVGNLAAKAISEQTATTVFADETAYDVGAVLKESASSARRGIVVKPITTTINVDGTEFADLVEDGYIVVLDLVKVVAKPTDTSTGENFLLEVKKDLEIAADVSSGHSLNGNTVGAVKDLLLITRQGIKPVLDVKVNAGAFHPEDLALGAAVKPIIDFGADSITVGGAAIDISKVYAVMIDRRALRLHPTYQAVRLQENAVGDFVKYIKHQDNTAFESQYAFIRVYMSE